MLTQDDIPCIVGAVLNSLPNHQAVSGTLAGEEDLSHPSQHSVNDGIPSSLCSLIYLGGQCSTEYYENRPRGIISQSRHKKCVQDRHLVTMKWNRQIYIDTCLPFSLRSAPKLFNILADLLAWIAQENGVSNNIRYLDNFLTMGPPDSSTCQRNLDIFTQLYKDLRVPLAVEKIEGPSTSLTFLGIILDTEQMEIGFPDEKLKHIKVTLEEWLRCKKATKRQIHSMVGLLQHATKVVKCGRTFVGRLYAAADFYTRI